MGGTIDYESVPGKGTLVTIEVPLQIQPQRQNDNTASFGPNRTIAHCALIGFDDSSRFGIHVAGEFLKRKLQRRHADVCSIEDANIVIIEERALNDTVVERLQALIQLHEVDTIVLGSATSKRRWRSNPPFLDRDRIVPVRWLFRPLNPGLMRQILNKGHSSISGDFERRRSSTWTTYPSRASLVSTFSHSDHSASSISADSISEVVVITTSPTTSKTTELAAEAETCILPPQVPARRWENDLQFSRQCLPASEVKGTQTAYIQGASIDQSRLMNFLM
jgi:hypothetical protein